MPFDPRMLAGPSLVVLGALHLFIAYRLWRVHPLNRVFRLGPYVTERGIKAVIETRLLLAILGLFFVVFGLAGIVFWFARRDVNDPVVSFLGSLGAGLGLWAAALATYSVLRLWRAG